jgi:hypothetical protein
MFKYIREILTTFTPKQRILALLLLLTSICIITIGPKVIQTLSHDDTTIYNRLDIQKKLIQTQSIEINALHDSIILNQRSCTNRVMEREMEIIAMIENLENSINNQQPQLVRNERRTSPSNGMVDSIVIARSERPVEQIDTKTPQLMDGLKSIKRKIKTHTN